MARPSAAIKDRGLLEAALQGLEAQKTKIEEQILQVRSLLGRRRGRPPKNASAQPVVAAQPSGKRELSPAARKRIAAAQKKRWAEFRKKQTEK